MSQNLNSAVAVIGTDIGKNSFHVVGLNVISGLWQIDARMLDVGSRPAASGLRWDASSARRGALTTAEFGKFIANEIEKWAKVIKFANIKVDLITTPASHSITLRSAN
jgi:hypothetical protein